MNSFIIARETKKDEKRTKKSKLHLEPNQTCKMELFAKNS